MIDAKELAELANMRRSFSMDLPLDFAVDKKGRKFKYPINRPKDKLPRGMVRCFVRLGRLIIPSRS